MKLMSLLLFLLIPTAFAQSFRTDLQQALQKTLCQEPQRIPDTRSLWQLGIFDTQMDAAWIKSSDDQHTLFEADVAQIASEQASSKKHQGFAYGLCGPHLAWILSSPAAAPITQWTPDGLVFNLKLLHDRCKTFDLTYAHALRGRPKQIASFPSLKEETLTVHPELLEPGTIGLTCHPDDKTKQGPELWTLIPIKKLKAEKVPGFSSSSASEISSLISWIQSIRQIQGLKPLKTENTLLSKFANQLVQDTSIRHPRALLLEQRKLLAKKQIKILGENRVKAASTEQMAWLLWYSPTHRQLLLHKSASALGFDVARLQHEKLLVLVLAKI